MAFLFILYPRPIAGCSQQSALLAGKKRSKKCSTVVLWHGNDSVFPYFAEEHSSQTGTEAVFLGVAFSVIHKLGRGILLSFFLIDNTDKCTKELVVGPCRARLLRFYYNLRTQRCESFTYGGCLGNENNFETLKSCRYHCEKQAAKPTGGEHLSHIFGDPQHAHSIL